MTTDVNHWAEFGRIDERGDVYVRTSRGERRIGTYRAGRHDEALQHYARRFDDLLIEVDMIEARAASGAADIAHVLAYIERLRKGLDTAVVVGDLDMLAARLDNLATTLANQPRIGRRPPTRQAATPQPTAPEPGRTQPPRAAAEPAPSPAATAAFEVMLLWDEIISATPDPARCVAYLARHGNVPRADVERLRRTRNSCAHPAESGLPDADELHIALATARRIRDHLPAAP